MYLTVTEQGMTLTEAQEWDAEVGKTGNRLRGLLQEGYQREAWRVLGYANWTSCLQAIAEKHGFTERRLWQLHQANEIQARITETVSVDGTISDRHLHPLNKLKPEEQAAAYQEAVETAPNGKVTAAHVAEVVERRLSNIVDCPNCFNLYDGNKFSDCPYCAAKSYGAASPFHVNDNLLPIRKEGATPYNNHAASDDPDYDGDEWFTPAEYVEAARLVLGGIDLDPASHEAAQGVIQAGAYYTKESNGLARPWFGRVWLNPPYSMPLVKEFVLTAIDEYESGRVEAAVILTNNSSDTTWFHALLAMYPACFTRGRVQFWRPGQSSFAARQGQVFFYLGDNPRLFAETFGQFGLVVRGWTGDD